MGMIFRKNQDQFKKRLKIGLKLFKKREKRTFLYKYDKTERIVRSFLNVLNVDIGTASEETIYLILKAYIFIWIRITLNAHYAPDLISVVIVGNSELIKTEKEARQLIAFCKINLIDNDFYIYNKNERNKFCLFEYDANIDNNINLDLLTQNTISSDIEKIINSFIESNYSYFLFLQSYSDFNVEKNFKYGWLCLEKNDFRVASNFYRNCIYSYIYNIVNNEPTKEIKLNEIDNIIISAQFELIECYIRMHRYKTARERLEAVKSYLVKDYDRAAFYRKYAYIASELYEFEIAKACCLYSLEFEDSEISKTELEYINKFLPDDNKPFNIVDVLTKGHISIIQKES